MKVALFTDTYLPQINGVTKTLEKYVEYMEKNDIEYRIFAPVDGDKEYNNNIIRFFSFKFFLYPDCRVSLPNYFSVSKELDEFKPDIIHVVTPFNIGLCGLTYAKSHQIPLVSSYHTNISQYLEYFHLKFLTNISWDFFRWFHKHCKKNYCPSQVTYKLLESEGIKDLAIWGRGIDAIKFSPDNRDVDYRKLLNIDDKLVFLYVGRISPEKDLDIFMETAKKLNKKYMDKIHFLMVGNGPLYNEVKENILPNMTLTGFLQGEDLTKAYASSDIFMFPSPTETYGNVILEAMASGLSTIACYAGGIKENLIDEHNGLACNEKSKEDFYNAAERMIVNSALREKIAQTGRIYCLKRNWNNIFDKLFNSYKEVVENASANSSDSSHKKKISA